MLNGDAASTFMADLIAQSGARIDPLPAAAPPMRWEDFGLMELTGPAEGPPLRPTRDYAARLGELVATVNAYAALNGSGQIAHTGLYAARAAALGVRRRGRISANGSCRMIRACDGWIAVNLPRDDDIDCVPAWLESFVDDDIWAAIARIAQMRSVHSLVERAQLLGLAVAAVSTNDRKLYEPPARFTRYAIERGRGGPNRRHIVLDFSSLWAGPLCGMLLAKAGCRVIKVESLHRPDGMRRGSDTTFDYLNDRKESLALDFTCDTQLLALQRLMRHADVVIEASRPRAFAQLGLSANSAFAANPGLTWIGITAYGRDGISDNRIGFGDDVAAGAGLVVWGHDNCPNFVGDALADPISGVVATAAALASTRSGGGYFIDVSMHRAARYVAQAPIIGNDVIQREFAKDLAAKPPRSEPICAKGPVLGAHTDAILEEFA